MIKINLITETSVSDRETKLTLIAYVASLVFCLIVAIITNRSIASENATLTQERDSLQSDLNSLLVKTKAVRELEEKKNTLRDKLALLAKLKKSKIGPVRVLDDLNTAVPGRVWLRDVKEEGGAFKISGRALDNQDIAAFMQNLQNSNFFSQIDLLESRQMYYSKRTGMVEPLPDMGQLQGEAFAKDKRATKEIANIAGSNSGGKWQIKRPGQDEDKDKDKDKLQERKEKIEEANIKIKEFVLSAKVHYEGKPLEPVKVETTADETKNN